MHVAVVYSSTTLQYQTTEFSAADDDTTLSAHEVGDALKKCGFDVSLIEVRLDNIESVISTIHADCIFNLIEWTGSDLPHALFACSLIEKLRIPCTGASSNNYHFNGDKLIMKRAFDAMCIPTPRWQGFLHGGEEIRGDLPYPLMIKPSLQHCSIGLSREMIVDDARQLRAQVRKQIDRFGESVFAEEFIEGREFHVTVLERDGKPFVLPPVEITFFRPGKDSFLTYESRWDPDHADYQLSDIGLPKTHEPKLINRMKQLCRKIFTAFDFRDYMRVDLRVRGDEIFILEANCNPGLSEDDESAIPIAYHAAGMSMADSVCAIVDSSMRRFGKIIGK